MLVVTVRRETRALVRVPEGCHMVRADLVERMVGDVDRC